MALNVSRIVDVNISVSALALQSAGFGTFNIIGTSDVIPMSERIRSYDDIDGVAADFETTSEEYIAANIFFSQSPSPTELYISRRAASATPAELVGGSNAETTISTWSAITNGEFSLEIDETELYPLSINFASVTSMDDVATAIDGAMSTGSCEWDSDNTRFIFKSVTTGSSSSITFASVPASGTDISGLLDCRSTDGGTIADGVGAETISTSLSAIEALNSKWYGFGFTSEVRDDSQTSAGTQSDALDAASWAEARTKVFANNSSDANTLVSGNTSSIGYQIEALGYNRTFTVYNAGDYPAISAFARGATVDFDGTDTAITYKFKQLPGISATDLSASQANALIDVNCNYYANFGTQLSGDSVSILAEGVVASGRFIDEIIGLDWLQNEIQTEVFNYLYTSTTKIPQTDAGVAGITQTLEDVLDQAVNNGLAAPGTVTIDGNDVFLEKGYLTFTGLVSDQSQSDRESREAPPISFILKGAGAIHSVTITGTFVR